MVRQGSPEFNEGLTTNVICIVDRNSEQLFSGFTRFHDLGGYCDIRLLIGVFLSRN